MNEIDLLNVSDSGVSASMSGLILISLLTVAPVIIITMTPFLRITIVLSILRQAMGLTTVPTNKVISALSLVLAMYIMNPVLQKINDDAITPYRDGKISIEEVVSLSLPTLKNFMLDQTKKENVEVFLDKAGVKAESREDIPFHVAWISFVTSEITTALKIGFYIYLPFVAVDLIVAGTLMSLGMMMVSPMIISTPIKILLLVAVDGWLNLSSTLTNTFFFGG